MNIKCIWFAVVLTIFFSEANGVEETSVQAIALFNGRAMLSIDGAPAKIIREGDTHHNVKLVSSSTSNAIIEVNGKQEPLTLNGGVVLSRSLAAPPSRSYSQSYQMKVDGSGFFRGDGAINGRNLEFLVDTGANLVVLNSRDADAINLPYTHGTKNFASTASGKTPMFTIVLKSITIGGIELENVSAGVIVGAFPEIPLLGMTFLGRLNMSREGDTMTLTRR